MNNVVTELEILKNAMDLEVELRHATDVELRNNIDNGPMRVAHDAAIDAVVQAARALVDKADSE